MSDTRFAIVSIKEFEELQTKNRALNFERGGWLRRIDELEYTLNCVTCAPLWARFKYMFTGHPYDLTPKEKNYA